MLTVKGIFIVNAINQ